MKQGEHNLLTFIDIRIENMFLNFESTKIQKNLNVMTAVFRLIEKKKIEKPLSQADLIFFIHSINVFII